jgi:hypothetical protein
MVSQFRGCLLNAVVSSLDPLLWQESLLLLPFLLLLSSLLLLVFPTFLLPGVPSYSCFCFPSVVGFPALLGFPAVAGVHV